MRKDRGRARQTGTTKLRGDFCNFLNPLKIVLRRLCGREGQTVKEYIESACDFFSPSGR